IVPSLSLELLWPTRHHGSSCDVSGRKTLRAFAHMAPCVHLSIRNQIAFLNISVFCSA
ncbi:hypothetical protein M405DRAFT_814543, partial [Rhizopogon salebrosus TDB-379]